VRVEWSPEALASAHRFFTDQAGMRAVNKAVAALAEDQEPPGAFVRGEYRRLRVGLYRVHYTVKGDTVTVLRVDRLPHAQ
jgi:mRNA-degrading endonuclease RelE of RelBE toxin-antitoxin system